VALYGTGSNPKIEALINGTWTDVSSRVRGEQKVVISRGRANEQGRTAAQTCNLTLENPDGYFSNRDPSSANFGLIPKNTQLRVAAGTGDNYAWLPYNDQDDANYVNTADKAVLDITSDIDVRAELWPHSWRPGSQMMIASKWNSGTNNRSWIFYIGTDGTLYFSWTTDGASGTQVTVQSTAAVPSTSGQLAVKATLDVNNGAAGNDVKFYTASSIAASYTQLGSTVTTAGTTSIFSSSATVVVGGADSHSGGIPFGGKVYKAEVYNGIGGTRVANMDATSRSVGDTSWSDGLATSNTWNVIGGARITTDRLRFWGELSSLPKRWDQTGQDVTIPATASGMIRRKTQGATPLRSPMYRNFTQYSPHGYWPFEDGSDSNSAASAVASGTAATVTHVSFATATDLPGAETTLSLTGSTSTIDGVANSTSSTGTASFVFYVKVSALPVAKSTIISLTSNGATARRIEIGLESTAWHIDFYDSGGTSLGGISTAIGSINPTGQWIGYNLLLQTSGSDMTYSQRWDAIGTYGGGTGPTTISTATVKPFSRFSIQASTATEFNDAQFAHIFMSTQNLDLSTSMFRNASNAYLAESAAARFDRLCTEEGVPFEVTGFYADTELMGYQSTSTFMDLVYECWDSDGGIGGEARNLLALTYRTRRDLERRGDVTLAYDSSHLSQVPQPTDDDQGLVNDVTARRRNASFYRIEVTDGANCTSDPPTGVGRYPVDVTLNLSSDADLPDVAGWIALVGSWDQDRYPNLDVSLHRTAISGSTTLTSQISAVNLGDTIILTGMPVWTSPDSIPELVQGYRETLSKFMWDITYNCTPAGPYRAVPLLGSDGFVPRLDGTTHTISGTMTTTATSVSFATVAGSAPWVDSATYASDFPFTVKIAGEVMSVTAITGAASPQTATVTRSVNGVVKSHSSGELVRLADPYYIGR
jgi:hypothetical protein